MTWRTISWQCNLWPLHSYSFMLYQGNFTDSLRACKLARLWPGEQSTGGKERLKRTGRMGRQRKRKEKESFLIPQQLKDVCPTDRKNGGHVKNSLKNDHFSQLAGIMLQMKGKRIRNETNSKLYILHS